MRSAPLDKQAELVDVFYDKERRLLGTTCPIRLLAFCGNFVIALPIGESLASRAGDKRGNPAILPRRFPINR
jgi:hypothetical protein